MNWSSNKNQLSLDSDPMVPPLQKLRKEEEEAGDGLSGCSQLTQKSLTATSESEDCI